MNQRQTDDYWQAYWGERFKSENEGYQHRIAALEARLALVTQDAEAGWAAYVNYREYHENDGTLYHKRNQEGLANHEALNSTKAG